MIFYCNLRMGLINDKCNHLPTNTHVNSDRITHINTHINIQWHMGKAVGRQQYSCSLVQGMRLITIKYVMHRQ